MYYISIHACLYSLLSREKSHTPKNSAIVGETLVFHDNNQLHSIKEKPQVEASFPQTDKELIWEKERGKRSR